MEKLYPFILEPAYKHYMWGGKKIPQFFHRQLSDEIYAESWELSDRSEGSSVILNGKYKGKTLRELFQLYGPSILGYEADKFPLLIKLLDAAKDLSIQVHPDNFWAEELSAEAKTEAWVVLDADPDACIYAGFKEGVSEASIMQHLGSEELLQDIKKIPVKAGDVIFIPGGRVHAVGKGCLVFEVQQNSNTTYRLYDWDRIDQEGHKRPLQIHEAQQVVYTDDFLSPLVTPRTLTLDKQLLIRSKYFEIQKLTMSTSQTFEQKSWEYHFIVKGSTKDGLKKGSSILIPHCSTPIHYDIESPLTIFRVLPVDLRR